MNYKGSLRSGKISWIAEQDDNDNNIYVVTILVKTKIKTIKINERIETTPHKVEDQLRIAVSKVTRPYLELL